MSKAFALRRVAQFGDRLGSNAHLPEIQAIRSLEIGPSVERWKPAVQAWINEPAMANE